MRALRTLFLTLLVVSLLPWGAYHARARTVAEPEVTLRVADMVVDELDGVELARRPALRSTSAAPPPRVEVRAQRCRTATLPGAGCGGDHALIGVPPTLPRSEREATLLPADTTLQPSHDEAPPRSPPRIG